MQASIFKFLMLAVMLLYLFSGQQLQIMIQRTRQSKPKQKQKKDKLSDKFKVKCSEVLKSFLKDKNIEFDVDSFQSDDIQFLEIMLNLPITKINIFCNPNIKKSPQARPFHESNKFKEFMKLIGKNIQESQTIKSIIFEKVPIKLKYIPILKSPIQQTNNLRELVMKDCSLTDAHIENIKKILSVNESLVIVDFSYNSLVEVGGMIGKVLSEHSRRRNDIVWIASLRGEKPEQDLSTKGICEINLESNQISDQSASDLISFLKDDNWTKCINLRNNKLTLEGVKSFALLLKKNISLISLDLRDNPGFTKQYSLYIFKKLKKNLENYKKMKKEILLQKDLTLHSEKKGQKYKSLEQSRRKSLQSRKKEHQISKLQFSLQNTLQPISRKNITFTNQKSNQCSKCKQTTFRLLKVEKRNLDLQLELKKLKNVLLTKNIDISAIIPNNSLLQNSLSFQRNLSDDDDNMLARMQQIMMELTKIMETVEGQHQTQINMTNPLSNANSLSNTIPIFGRPEELQELGISDSISQENQEQQPEE